MGENSEACAGLDFMPGYFSWGEYRGLHRTLMDDHACWLMMDMKLGSILILRPWASVGCHSIVCTRLWLVPVLMPWGWFEVSCSPSMVFHMHLFRGTTRLKQVIVLFPRAFHTTTVKARASHKVMFFGVSLGWWLSSRISFDFFMCDSLSPYLILCL